MPKPSAFVTPAYPVLFHVCRSREDQLPGGEAELLLGLLVDGSPSFLAAHRVPAEAVEDVVVSLQGGDPRVAVVGMWVDAPGVLPGQAQRRAAAFIGLVCADGRRITVARVLGEEAEASPDTLARHVIRQIARGVQVPDLVGR